MAKLTNKQRAFAAAKAEGLSAADAARKAGYAVESQQSLRVQASRNNANPEIQAEMRAIRERSISDLCTVALSTLADILQDQGAPAAARVSASKWVLEAGGHGIEAQKLLHRIGEGDERAVSQLSAADLEALVVMAADKVRFERGQVIDAETGETV